RLWANTRIVITPPETIKKQYQSITQKRKNQPSTRHQNKGENTLGLQLKTYRQKLGLTLEQTAEELEISAVYVSMIEREKRIPGEKIADRIINWIYINMLSQTLIQNYV